MDEATIDPFAIETESKERVMTLSDAAVARLRTIFSQEGDLSLMLRITVSGGGCSGFQYGFDFEKKIQQDDHIFEKDGIRIVTDDSSLDLLDGSELHFSDDLIGAAFQVRNPNATASCGCGTSFAIS